LVKYVDLPEYIGQNNVVTSNLATLKFKRAPNKLGTKGYSGRDTDKTKSSVSGTDLAP